MSIRQLPTILAVTILAAMFISSCGGGITQSDAGYTWDELYGNADMEFYSASILDSDHIWALSSETPETDSLYCTGIHFYNGSGWDMQSRAEGVVLQYIESLDFEHVWALGIGSDEKGTYACILFFDGKSWSEQYKDYDFGGLVSLSAVSSDCVFASGISIVFYDGTSWTRQADAQNMETGSFSHISAADADNAWVLTSAGKVFFFNGSNWILQEEFAEEAGIGSKETNDPLNTIFALDFQNVWATQVFFESSGIDAELRTQVLYFNGMEWRNQQLFDTAIIDIHAVDPSHVWSVGLSREIGQIYLFDGSGWMLLQEIENGLITIKALDEQRVLVVGKDGSILRGNKD